MTKIIDVTVFTMMHVDNIFVDWMAFDRNEKFNKV